jgi:hypothetical protein
MGYRSQEGGKAMSVMDSIEEAYQERIISLEAAVEEKDRCIKGWMAARDNDLDLIGNRNKQIATLKNELSDLSGFMDTARERIKALTADVQKWIKIAGENQKSANLCAAKSARYREALEKILPMVKGCAAEHETPSEANKRRWMMSDQCTHCECQGNLNRCELTDCFVRESWYSITLQNKFASLETAVKEKDKEIDHLENTILNPGEDINERGSTTILNQEFWFICSNREKAIIDGGVVR